MNARYIVTCGSLARDGDESDLSIVICKETAVGTQCGDAGAAGSVLPL